MASTPAAGIFRFLDLPAELRNKVCFEVLGPDPQRNWNWSFIRISRKVHFDYRWSPPAILQTCRQLREEARLIYYSFNGFEFSHSTLWVEDAVNWFTTLKHKDALAVRLVRADGGSTLTTKEALESFDRLYDRMEDAGFFLKGDNLKLWVQSYVDVGDGICCGGGCCLDYGRYAVHRVSYKQLKSLIKMEVEAEFPICYGRLL